MAVDILMGTKDSAGRARELFTSNHSSSNPLRSYDLTLDGQTFLMLKPDPQPYEPVTHMRVTLNWFEELKRLAPTD